eukprot:COSAG02_NODE_155_length_33066_cov_32.167562_27_plen_293_part_00
MAAIAGNHRGCERTVMLRSVLQHLQGPRSDVDCCGCCSASRATSPSAGAAPVLDVFDPHFHLFDPDAVHSGNRSDGSSFVAYYQPDYEADMARLPDDFRHVGGCWVEAMSVCFALLDAPALQHHCLMEAAFVAAELHRSSQKYVLCASACLEDPAVSDTLRQLVDSQPGMRAIRQIANVDPDWPRNGRLGDLVRQAQWRAGYAQLARYGLGFDLQCNPWQLESYVREVVAPNPSVPCVLNHLGLPLLGELSNPDQAGVYWRGMEALARCPHGAPLSHTLTRNELLESTSCGV